MSYIPNESIYTIAKIMIHNKYIYYLKKRQTYIQPIIYDNIPIPTTLQIPLLLDNPLTHQEINKSFWSRPEPKHESKIYDTNTMLELFESNKYFD